jgi:hypothetical protein
LAEVVVDDNKTSILDKISEIENWMFIKFYLIVINFLLILI